jgi:hypothetical protein
MQINSDVVARLGATYEYRDYDSGSNRNNQRSYGASAGLTWSINRYLDLEADASYERTEEPGAPMRKPPASARSQVAAVIAAGRTAILPAATPGSHAAVMPSRSGLQFSATTSA